MASESVTPGSSGESSDPTFVGPGPAEYVEWDWMTGLPLTRLAYTLRTMVPADHIHNYSTLLSESIKTTFTNIFGDSSLFKLLFSSSSFQQLTIPLYTAKSTGKIDVNSLQTSDTDVLLVRTDRVVIHPQEGQPTETDNVYAQIDTSKTSPGFLRLRLLEDMATSMDGQAYVDSSTTFSDSLDKDTGNVTRGSMTVSVKDTTYNKQFLFAQDYTDAFRCSSWPPQASTWKSRPRASDWPTASMIDYVTNEGCHIVAKAHEKSSCSKLEWMYCFAQAENLLVSSLNDTQRQCYVLLEILRQQELDLPSMLTAQHMKMLLFWMCERVPASEWNPEGISSCFLALLDELIYCLLNQHLPHYFLSGVNCLEGVHEDFTIDLLRRTISLREDPLAALSRFNSRYHFSFSPLQQAWEELLKEAKDFQEGMRVKEEPSQVIFGGDQKQSHLNPVTRLHVLNKTALLLLTQGEFDKAYECFEQIAQIQQMLGNVRSTASALMEHTAYEECNLEQSCQVMEYLVKRNPDSTSTINNLACMYHAIMFQESSDTERKVWAEKAEKTFKQALQTGQQPAWNTDYSLFLLNEKRYEEAVPLLVAVISSDQAPESSGNCYGKLELPTVDSNIQKEIEATGTFSCSSVAISCYLLVKCYAQLNKTDDLSHVCAQLQNICEKASKAYKLESYLLLGYSYVVAEDFPAAERAFVEARVIKPDHASIEENIMLCQAMKLSLQNTD